MSQYGPEFDAYADHFRKNVLPMVEESKIFLSVTPSNPKELDVKFATEMGMAIMLDKPIIAIVRAGTKTPEKLSRVVDQFVEMDEPEDPGFKERFQNTLASFMEKIEDE